MVLEQGHYDLVQEGYSLVQEDYSLMLVLGHCSLVLVLEQEHYNLVQEGYNLVLEQRLGDCSLLLGQAHCSLM